jgi:outer membrane protein OmpA-like peptidoglycan-associated protein
MKKSTVIFVVIAIMISANLFAQRTSDIEGSKDYPLVSRFEGSIIEYYKETKWDSYKLPVYEDNITEPNYKKPIELEGKIIRIQYSVSSDNNPAYVMKNFEKAFKSNNYKILLEGRPGNGIEEGPAGFNGDFYGSQKGLNLNKFRYAYEPTGDGDKAIIIAKTNSNGKAIYIVEVIGGFANTTLITQDIIEVEEAETGKVTTVAINKAITSNGHIAIYDIHFDTGKSEIKSESKKALQNIAKYLNAHSDKKYIIVGHTDNVGDFEANLKLSKERADAVKNELVSKYSVKAEQLIAYGDGQTAPVTTNATKEGRAKNRRVEIVEQ